MPLAPGTRLGPYEILAAIGAGGMREMYRARDTKLGREVAVKVLPAALAQDPERLLRFEREAKVLASLKHPNIAQIYGVEDRALIIELVDGEAPKGPLPSETVLHSAISLWGWLRPAPPATRIVTHFSTDVLEETGPIVAIAVSREGSRIAFPGRLRRSAGALGQVDRTTETRELSTRTMSCCSYSNRDADSRPEGGTLACLNGKIGVNA
jgi:hypothetical protein